MRPVWRVRLGRQAEQDYLEILQWTTKTFGKGQARIYAEAMARAIEALEDGPDAWICHGTCLRLVSANPDAPLRNWRVA